jgi:hypothetical protein
MKRNRLMTRAGAASAAMAVAFSAVAPAVPAADIAYRATLGVGHSDNIRRTAGNEEDETIGSAGLQFSVDQRTAKLTADVVGDLAYQDYLNNTFDSELTGNVAGSARFAFAPERFEWMISDNFGQVLSDPFAPATPDNRENINVLTTGPDFGLRLGSQTKLHLGARYSLTTYETRPLDSDMVSGELSLIRELSSSSSVALIGQTQSVKYDEATLNADYDQSQGFVRYDATGARTHLAVDVGYTQLEPDNAESQHGLLFRLNVARRLSPSTTATLDAGREFSNAATAFASIQGANGIGLGTVPGVQSAQPFTNDRAVLSWNFSRNRTGFTLTAGWFDQSYEDPAAIDQTLTTFSAQVSRELSQTTTLSLRGGYTRGKFEDSSGDYKEFNAGTAFEWRLSRAVSLSLSYDYWDRNGNAAAGDYKENRVWLAIGYGRGTPRTTFNMPTFGVDE